MGAVAASQIAVQASLILVAQRLRALLITLGIKRKTKMIVDTYSQNSHMHLNLMLLHTREID
jgi:hypothetical protein